MGDYNIDMTKTDTQPLKLINTLAYFHSLINNPTRIAHTSKTLLDNIFSNSIDVNDFTNGIYTMIFRIICQFVLFPIIQRPYKISKTQHLNYIGKKLRKILIC